MGQEFVPKTRAPQVCNDVYMFADAYIHHNCSFSASAYIYVCIFRCTQIEVELQGGQEALVASGLLQLPCERELPIYLLHNIFQSSIYSLVTY